MDHLNTDVLVVGGRQKYIHTGSLRRVVVEGFDGFAVIHSSGTFTSYELTKLY